MTQTLQFRYYYKNQAEQFHFYKIPKVLFTDARFKGLSAEAKILYGLMLDRMSLSMKNGWMDSQNRIYIYFTLEDAVELLGCGHGKAVRLFSELDSVKGIGLIERKKQGQGKPAKIYVKNFLEDEAVDGDSDENKTFQNRNSEKGDFQGKDEQFSQNGNSQQGVTSDFQKSALLKKESQDLSKLGSPDIPFSGSLDFPKSNGNNTDLSKTERNDTESFYDSMDGMECAREKQEMEQLIRRNIEYDVLFLRNPSCDREIDEIVSLMTEVATSRRSTIHLDKQDIPQPMVKERLLSLQCEHIEYVLERMQRSTANLNTGKTEQGGGTMKRKEGRTIGLYTKVSPEEKELIAKKMALLGTKNQRAYLRKMALDGYVIHLDMSDVQELIRLLRNVSNNVNQIARRANETRNLYAEDVEDIRQGYLAVWKQIGKLMDKLEI